ncbi:hypothetical protein [Streptomyces sp. SA15]|uniref:hypothetical protein n=1 Tax=Streptomyces sp. SA15 TaxID=934019 RepID=UPI00117D4361|nr:hypothetical protein [Streptomyces sp. SA15]
MTGRSTGPAGAGPSSFTSSPSDSGRAYQASGDQNFHEHHYHGSAPPLPPSAPNRRKPALYALTGSLTAMAAVLVLLGGAGGTWLLLRSVSSEDSKAAADAPRPDAPARQTASVAPSSASPSASRSTTSRPSTPAAPAAPPTKATAEPKPSPTPATRNPSASALPSWKNPAPDKQCRAWVAAGVADVETRPCWRREGDRVFMIAEWRTTKGTVLVDVHLWLKDKDGYHAVYPTDTSLKFPGEVASPQGTGKKQWGEREIHTDLVQGATYQVNVRVQLKESTPPNVKNPDVDGAQFPFVY